MEPNPVMLSKTNAAEATSTLQNLLNEPSGTLTLIIVMGEDNPAQEAQAFATKLVLGNPASYKSIGFVFCPNPAFIRNTLQALEIKIPDPHHPLNWDQYETYTVFAISPLKNIIADVLTKTQVSSAVGLIKLSILAALGIEKKALHI